MKLMKILKVEDWKERVQNLDNYSATAVIKSITKLCYC